MYNNIYVNIYTYIYIYVYVYIYTHIHKYIYFPGGLDGKESACNAGDLGLIPGMGRSPEKGMATHSSNLA